MRKNTGKQIDITWGVLMDWIKVKIGHAVYEYADLRDSEFRVWIGAMALTAIMEKVPTPEILAKNFNPRTLNSLENKLKLHRTTLETILNKVYDDVEYTKHLRSKNTSKIAEWRRKQADVTQLQLPVTLPVTYPDKIREDKIREDKINVSTTTYVDWEQSTLTFWNSFCEIYPILSKIKEISGTRRKKLKARYGSASFKDFNKIIKCIEGQNFLLGKNDRGWKVSFDWIIENDTNYIKILENKYADKQTVEDKVEKILRGNK
jgi:hypothetical protein